MTLTAEDIQALQTKYSYLTNYEDEDFDAPIDPLTYVDSNGDTLLHLAAQIGDFRTIQLLVGAGVDVNKLGDMGNTALHYTQSGEIARFLIEKGASTKISNEFGKLPSWCD
jgi:ankyrin repeat protein